MTLFILTSCGKKIADHKVAPTAKRQTKSAISQPETWRILSQGILPSKVKVMINDLEFINECTGLGNFVIERTKTNASINISSYSAFRQEYFSVDIFDCKYNSKFYSEPYVDQQLIEHPVTGAISVILRLKN